MLLTEHNLLALLYQWVWRNVQFLTQERHDDNTMTMCKQHVWSHMSIVICHVLLSHFTTYPVWIGEGCKFPIGKSNVMVKLIGNEMENLQVYKNKKHFFAPQQILKI